MLFVMFHYPADYSLLGYWAQLTYEDDQGATRVGVADFTEAQAQQFLSFLWPLVSAVWAVLGHFFVYPGLLC